METLHIRLETGEAVNSKRKLLSTELNLLNLIKLIQNYRDLRKREMIKKIALKSRIGELGMMMKKLKEELPKVKMPKEEEEVVFEAPKKARLEDELREIREKLARLS